MVPARQLQRRVTVLQRPHGFFDDVGPCSQQIGTQALGGTGVQQRMHRIDAGYPLRNGDTQAASCPYDPHAICDTKLCTKQCLAQLGILLQVDQLGGVDVRQPQRLACLHAVQCALHDLFLCHQADGGAEYDGLRLGRERLIQCPLVSPAGEPSNPVCTEHGLKGFKAHTPSRRDRRSLSVSGLLQKRFALGRRHGGNGRAFLSRACLLIKIAGRTVCGGDGFPASQAYDALQAVCTEIAGVRWMHCRPGCTRDERIGDFDGQATFGRTDGGKPPEHTHRVDQMFEGMKERDQIKRTDLVDLLEFDEPNGGAIECQGALCMTWLDREQQQVIAQGMQAAKKGAVAGTYLQNPGMAGQ